MSWTQKQSSNLCWYQATSCLSGLASKIVSWNQQHPEISPGIKSHHFHHVLASKIVSLNQQSPEISPGITPCPVYHV